MIIESIYDRTSALHWLKANGGWAISDQEVAELKVRPIVGDKWLLPVDWSGSGTVVVDLDPRFPDVPPRFFLPYEARKNEIIPHVGEDGFICILKPGVAIDPKAPVAVLEILCDRARTIVQRKYTPDQWLSEVEPELAAYWTINPKFSLVHCLESVPESLAASVVHVDPQPNLFRILPLAAAGSKAYDQIALGVNCPKSSLNQFLLDPEKWLRETCSVEASVTTLFKIAGGRGIPTKTSDIWLLISCETSSGVVLLPAKLPSKIRLKGQSREKVIEDLHRKLGEGKLIRGLAEDCSTQRLMRRSGGTECENYGETKIAVIGCGSLGGFVSDILTRAGLRHFMLIDGETLKIANLPRHVCGFEWVDHPKVIALKSHIERILPDACIKILPGDFRQDDAITATQAYSADLTLIATGDTNSDITASRFCQAGIIQNACFSWVEPKMVAGHLIYLPTGDSLGIADLFDSETGYYKNRIIHHPDTHELQEQGCQASYLPFSGMDLVGFSAIVAKQLLLWAADPPLTRKVLRYSGPNLVAREEL